MGAGADAVDFKLISLCEKGDLVVTQDYGVAAMALSKGAYAIHQSGKWYTNENIDLMLMERHISKKARLASSKNHMKGPRKRSDKDDLNFEASFERLVEKYQHLDTSRMSGRAGFKYVSTENIFYEVVGNRQFRMYEYVIE